MSPASPDAFRPRAALWLIVAPCLVVACTGEIGPTAPARGAQAPQGAGGEGMPTIGRPIDSPGAGGMGTGQGGPAGQGGQDVGPTDPTSAVTTMPLRRLSRREYHNTLRDLLGVTPTADELFSTDSSGASGFPEGGPVSSNEIDRMLAAAESLVARYGAGRLKAELPCQPRNDDDRACAQRFVQAFATRAYRHPPSAQELADLMALYDAARADRNLEASLLTVVQAALLSPRFHYRWELGDEAPKVEGGVVMLNGYEIASRLSYFLWQSMPDTALFEAAGRGELSDPARIRAQAQRMIADKTKAGDGIGGFFRTWLPVSSIETVTADAKNADFKTKAFASLMAFVDDLVLGEGDRRFATLLAGDYEFVDGRRTPITSRTRAGIFTQPAFLTATADTPLATVIHRGRFVYEKLGDCRSVPPLSGPIPETAPRRPEASVREHLSEHASEGTCRVCHQFMDPMGFAFEAFDELGRERQTDAYGKPARTDGEMPLNDSVTIKFEGAADLLRQLSQRPESLGCFAQQVATYALRTPANRDHLKPVKDAFIGGGGDIRDLFMSVAEAPSFIRRKPAKGEVLQ